MSTSSTVLQQAALSVSAYNRIKPWLSPTPCIPSRQVLTEKTELYYKADNFQKTGSFKFRGALSKLTSMSTDIQLSLLHREIMASAFQQLQS